VIALSLCVWILTQAALDLSSLDFIISGWLNTYHRAFLQRHCNVMATRFYYHNAQTILLCTLCTSAKIYIVCHQTDVPLKTVCINITLQYMLVNIHYMTKSVWTPAGRTSHSKIMGINMELFRPFAPIRIKSNFISHMRWIQQVT
jgi:hypothetical protein